MKIKVYLYLKSITLVLLNIFSISAYPEKIFIKNDTNNPISYRLDIEYANGCTMQNFLIWLEPSEERDIVKKHLGSTGPENLNTLHVGINNTDLKNSSLKDGFFPVNLGERRAIMIMVKVNKEGSLYHRVHAVEEKIE